MSTTVANCSACKLPIYDGALDPRAELPELLTMHVWLGERVRFRHWACVYGPSPRVRRLVARLKKRGKL